MVDNKYPNAQQYRKQTVGVKTSQRKAKELGEKFGLVLNTQNAISKVLRYSDFLYPEIDGVLAILIDQLSKNGIDIEGINKFISSNPDVLRQSEFGLASKLSVLSKYGLDKHAILNNPMLLTANRRVKETTLDYVVDLLRKPRYGYSDQEIKNFIDNKSYLLGQDAINLNRNLAFLCANGLLNSALFEDSLVLKRNYNSELLFAVISDLKKEEEDLTVDKIVEYADNLDAPQRTGLLMLYPLKPRNIGPAYSILDKYINTQDNNQIIRTREV